MVQEMWLMKFCQDHYMELKKKQEFVNIFFKWSLSMNNITDRFADTDAPSWELLHLSHARDAKDQENFISPTLSNSIWQCVGQ